MLSFHNDPAIKQKYLDRVIKHREMDNIIQGIGWAKGKGCAVGCTLESYDHTRYPIELGIPEWLAHLEDSIFESLPNDKAKTWPERFLNAIPIGKSLEDVRHLLAIKRLTRLIDIQRNLRESNPSLIEIFDQTINSIKLVIECHKAEINKKICDWSAAWSEATSTVESVWSAATSTVESVRSAEWSATSAAWSAATSTVESVRSAATSTEWSATSAAWSAATSIVESVKSAAWIEESENLLQILNEIK